MKAWLKEHWRFVLVVSGGVVFLLLMWAGLLRVYWPDWTGFGEYTGQVAKDDRGKTLWDWLQLLVIPIVLALGALLLEQSERISDRKIAQERWENDQKLAAERRDDDIKIAEDQQREAALQAYIDKMTELLLDQEHSLRESAEGDEVRVVARTRTLATLRKLDPTRKGMLLSFLYEGELISEINADMNEDRDLKHAILNLSGADLSEANLSGANLSGVELSEANLSGANLSRADLSEADLSFDNLSGANLSGADLSETDLSGANLSGADLSEAKLSEADLSWVNLNEAHLSRADLSGANLSRANLSGAELNKADLSWANLGRANLSKADLSGAIVDNDRLAMLGSLENATMPDGKKYDPAIHVSLKQQE
jgi:uncharacterized protein YjbI with pentapeptide repeats